MTRYARHMFSLALIGALLGAAPQAQARGGQPPRDRGGDAPALTPVEVLNMLDAYAVLQAQNTLQLSDEQYGDFVARLKRLQQTRRRHQQLRNRMLAELRRMVAPHVQQVDEHAVRDRLRQLAEHDAKAAAETKAAYDAIDQVLDVRQQARFRIFEQVLEGRKMDLLLRARRGAAGRGQ